MRIGPDHLIRWWIERNLRQMRTLVTPDNHDARRLILNVAVRFLLVAVVSFANSWNLELHDGFTGLVALAWGLMAASFALSPLLRAWAYRTGWWEGRQGTRESLRESELRGISREQWLLSEYARDMNINTEV